MRKSAIFTPMLFLFSLLLLPSCVATQQDVLALNRKIQTLDKESTNMKTVREKQAETGAEMDSVKQEIQRISGDQEENRNLIKHIIERDTSEQEDQKARLLKLEKRIDHLYQYLQLGPQTSENQGATRETALEEAGILPPKAPGPPPVKEEPPDLTGNALYEETLATYHEEKYKEAIAGFEAFLKQYPSSKLADNAQFWIGESYMSQKKYDQAIVAFQDVIEKYPDGNKVPNALLKQALAFYEIKDTISCRAILKKLVKNFPDSAEARIAEAKLKTIK